MSQRLAALIALAGCVLLLAGAWLSGGDLGLEDAPQERISFQIATGSTEGVYFPVGQAMAGVISHPAGIARCETATICGPAGVVLSARTSEGSADNLRAINSGVVDSGLAEGDVIAQGLAGEGAFRKTGKTRHLRAIAALFTEQAQLVVAAKSGIRSVGDLRGKRVMLGGGENTGASARARAILAAYRTGGVRVVPQSAGAPPQMLQAGKIDAYFTVAAAPVDSVRDLLARGLARLVPLDGEGRDRLLAAVPQLSGAAIPAGAYPGSGAVQTVSVHTWWVTRDSEADPLIYGVTRALFNPANRDLLTAAHPVAREINIDSAAKNPPAPLHSGAARFYREEAKL
jgi:TRAP transporter TAXI family solute receptor